MCSHYWRLDSCNKGQCKLCGKVKDFQPGINKAFRTTQKHVSDCVQNLNLIQTGGYCMQGSYTPPIRTTDYSFSVDNVY
jgi:hypothetical protein